MMTNEADGWLSADYQIPTEALDLFAGALCDAGTLGFEELPAQEATTVRVRAYFPAGTSSGAVAERMRPWLVALAGSERSSGLAQVPHLDWSRLWRESFTPLRVGERLLVVPSWSRVPTGDRLRVRIRPEMAFGTGHHETTQACLEALEGLVVPGQRVLDVGTGSGILAIAAAVLGAAQVDACDPDPVALENARGNLRLNRVQGRVRLWPGDIHGVPAGLKYDLIVANLVLESLRSDLADISGFLERSGVLIVAGLLRNQEADMLPVIARAGLHLRSKSVSNGWLLLQLEGTESGRSRERAAGRRP